jgi:exopolysaccharide production protein ExoQ
MNFFAWQYSRTTSRIQRFPWPTFLFFAVVFFFSQQGLHFLKRGVQASNPPEAELLTGVVEGSLSRQIALLTLGLFAVISLIRHRRVRLRLNSSLGWIVLFYVGWAVLSLGWAEDAALTFRRLVVFGILCLAAAAIASRFSLREILLLTFFCTVLFLLVGASAELVLGTFHPFTPGYRFAGSLGPNPQGINCALLLLSGVAAANTEKRRRIFFGTCALLGFVFLVFTGSRTALAAAIFALAVYVAVVLSRSAKIGLSLTLGIAFCLLSLVILDAPYSARRRVALLRMDDPFVSSLNGRTAIWADCQNYVDKRPILGYGFEGFWNERHISEISGIESWGVAEAHSAYLDCLLSLGFVGLATYVFALLGGVARSFALHRASRDPAFAFSAALLTFCVVHGFLESAMRNASLLMVLLMIILAQLGFACRRGGNLKGHA